MKKLFLLFALSILATGFSQGEQLYADGIATDQEGNEFEWINYGTQDWAIENADVETYRDGTTIPQVTDYEEWANLTTGAWCYYDNDPTKTRLYNWYAVMGIHDAASLTDPSLRKEFAPDGWHLPSDDEWTTLKVYLIANGYNYDGSSYSCSPCSLQQNKIAKSMTSTTGWFSSAAPGSPGNDQSLNNISGFNAFPVGYRIYLELDILEGYGTYFWSSTVYEQNSDLVWLRDLDVDSNTLNAWYSVRENGFSVRFIRDAQTASTNDNSIINFKIFPNPTKEYINIDCSSLETVTIYNILGKELIKETSNRINVSSLSKGVYFIKVSDGINSSTKKFIKD